MVSKSSLYLQNEFLMYCRSSSEKRYILNFPPKCCRLIKSNRISSRRPIGWFVIVPITLKVILIFQCRGNLKEFFVTPSTYSLPPPQPVIRSSWTHLQHYSLYLVYCRIFRVRRRTPDCAPCLEWFAVFIKIFP